MTMTDKYLSSKKCASNSKLNMLQHLYYKILMSYTKR